MTPEEIKKIAEEYAKSVNSAYLSQIAEKEALRVVRWLTERYYLVEKGKAKKERRYYEETEWVESVSISDLMGDIKDTFKQLFDPDIRKEEEE